MTVEIQTVDIYAPHRKQIMHVVKILLNGGVIVYPTDTIYGLAADIYNKEAVAKILKIKKASKNKLLSLICSDIKEVSAWAHIPNTAFRIMKRVLPGQYTFILSPSKEVPRSILQNRKTLGVRVPDSIIARKLVIELKRPLLNTSVPKGADDFFTDPQEIAKIFSNEIDIILDAGIMPDLPSTIIDLSEEPARVLREGAGSIEGLF